MTGDSTFAVEVMAKIKEEYGEAGEHANTILAEMERLGATYLVAPYSGGNDSGGVDSVRIYSGVLVDYEHDDMEYDISRALEAGALTEITSKLEEEGDGGYNHPLWMAVDRLLSTEYWSWAGEFEASGNVYGDLKQRRVWSRGSEQIYSDTPRLIDVVVAKPEPEPDEEIEVDLESSPEFLLARERYSKTVDLYTSARKLYEDGAAEVARQALLVLASYYPRIAGFAFEESSEYDDQGGYFTVITGYVRWVDDDDRELPGAVVGEDMLTEIVGDWISEATLERIGHDVSVEQLKEMEF